MASTRILRVGIIGCGEITQVAHIPTLGFLSSQFQITYLCDVSDGALEHCKSRVRGATPPHTTRHAAELCTSPDVDVVLIANSDVFHEPHAVLALQNDKFVFIEKPMALSLKSADRIIEAEKNSNGRVMVGYMRRYATGFLSAIEEIEMEDIHYARIRDIVGHNSAFVAQSGTFPRTFSDYRPEDVKELNDRTQEILEQALDKELGLPLTPGLSTMWRLLGGLGSHDLSAMREALGMPESVIGASLCRPKGPPFWSALFRYPTFTVSYESGIDNVLRFDAQIEIFGTDKTVKVIYDTPYIKGLPVLVEIKERLPDGSYRESTVRKTFEDPYTLEMKELYAAVVEGKPIKTTAQDARKDVEIFGMIMQAGA